jgi:hypothetical protein
MVPISKIVGVMSCGFVLCVGLSHAYAAHPQAETDMSNDRGSQGNQEMVKGESGPAAGKEGRSGGKMKKDHKSAKQSVDHRNDKNQGTTGQKSKGNH